MRALQAPQFLVHRSETPEMANWQWKYWKTSTVGSREKASKQEVFGSKSLQDFLMRLLRWLRCDPHKLRFLRAEGFSVHKPSSSDALRFETLSDVFFAGAEFLWAVLNRKVVGLYADPLRSRWNGRVGPPKTNMKPKSCWFVDVSPFPAGYLRVPT